MNTKIEKNIDKYLSLPEEYPAELIGGELIVTPSLSYKHQKIALDFAFKLKKIVDEKRIGEVLYEFDVHIDDDNVVKPDIIFISKERLSNITENWLEGSPNIVVEILSPYTASKDLIDKKELYEKSGVEEYWVVDIEREFVYVFINEDGKFKLYCKGKKCSSKIINGYEWGFNLHQSK